MDVGLVLEGGGGKGAYQIGVWQALRELGIEDHIKVVSGTSVGALNAALFWQGDLHLAKDIWFHISPDQLLTDDGQDRESFFSNKGLSCFISNALSSSKRRTMLCYAACKDVEDGAIEYFELSRIIDPGYKKTILLASSAMPAIYPTVKINGKRYTDGGSNGDNIPIFPVYKNEISTIIVVRLSQGTKIERSRWPGAEIIEVIPSEPLGGMLSGTLDFSGVGARHRFSLGYSDALAQLDGFHQIFLAKRTPPPRPVQVDNSISELSFSKKSCKQKPIEKIQKEKEDMDKIVFQSEALQRQYDKRYEELRKIAESPALKTEILWDKTAAKYAETIARVRLLMGEEELQKDVPTRLDKQLRTFLEKCMNPEFHIALVGAIKAGKSSLINAILGEELASTEVTPETAALTKFRRSSGKDYIRVSFYSVDEWGALWESASGEEDSKFMQEYRQLQAGNEKEQWVGREAVYVECETTDVLKETIHKWTSSQSATHYFVKEVEVGLNRFPLPEGVVLVDTPGLNDAVAYRSDITKDYIDRANAVLVCVKADNLTGSELSTICGVFSNARYNPEKVYIVATQQDSLNDPREDWKKQSAVWISYLKDKSCYGDEQLARKNLIPTSGYFYTLLTHLEHLTSARQFQLYASAMKLKCMPDAIVEKQEELLDFTGISRLKRKINQEIVRKYRDLLLEDIKSNYDVCKEAISEVLQNIRENQEKLIHLSTQSLDEIAAAQKENEKKLAEARSDQEELEELVEEIRKQTGTRTTQLIEAIRGLRR